MRKPVFSGLRKTKVQTSLRSLVRTFVIHLLESIISKLATSETSISYLVSVAEQADLSLTWSDTPKTGYLATRHI